MITVDLNSYCSNLGLWGKITTPECWGTGDTLTGTSVGPISAAPSVNFAPPAPITQGAMTVQGVWTSDYAMQRAQDNVTTENLMMQAAAEANQSGDANIPDPNACDSSLYSWTHPTECGLIGFNLNPIFIFVGIGAVAALLLSKRGGR